MNFPPIGNVARANLTLRQLEDAVAASEAGLWEPQTVIIVVIFGLVCFLHLTAFLYTVCLQSYVHAARPQTLTYPPGSPLRKDGGGKKCLHVLSRWLNDNAPKREKTPIMIDM